MEGEQCSTYMVTGLEQIQILCYWYWHTCFSDRPTQHRYIQWMESLLEKPYKKDNPAKEIQKVIWIAQIQIPFVLKMAQVQIPKSNPIDSDSGFQWSNDEVNRCKWLQLRRHSHHKFIPSIATMYDTINQSKHATQLLWAPTALEIVIWNIFPSISGFKATQTNDKYGPFYICGESV